MGGGACSRWARASSVRDYGLQGWGGGGGGGVGGVGVLVQESVCDGGFLDALECGFLRERWLMRCSFISSM